jgi:hypothetical protein
LVRQDTGILPALIGRFRGVAGSFSACQISRPDLGTGKTSTIHLPVAITLTGACQNSAPEITGEYIVNDNFEFGNYPGIPGGGITIDPFPPPS